MLDYILALVTFLVTLIVYLLASLFADTQSLHARVIGGAALPPATDFQRRIGKKYKQTSARKTFKQFCYPTEYEIQPQQKFVSEWMERNSGDSPKELLLFHEIGSGKTCAAIQIGEKYSKPVIVMPASLIQGFRSELRSDCVGEKYITAEERQQLHKLTPGSSDYKKIIKRSDERIDKHYQIFSYNKFMDVHETVRGDIIICDEVQNISNRNGKYYKSVLNWIQSHPRASVVMMTATPIFDNPSELTGLAELLRVNVSIRTPDDLKYLEKKISYYPGAPSKTFPEVNIKIVKCKMSAHQAQWYNTDLAAEMSKYGNIILEEAPNEFYANTRQRANIAYPRGLTGEAGLRALTPTVIRNNLSTYSCKMAQLIKRLKKRKHNFVFSNYKGPGGISAITKCIEAHGFKNYFTHGPGPGRYAVWSGDTSDAEREEIRAVFNHENNDNANKLGTIIGSPSMRAGVSLLRVRNAHIMETYWNHPYLEQIYGRVNRYCSHKRLPPNERNVKIYLYASYSGEPGPTPDQSIDLYMLKIADNKKEAAKPWYDGLMMRAIDRLVYN